MKNIANSSCAVGLAAALGLISACAAPAATPAEQLFDLHNPLPWTRSAADVVIDRGQIDLEPGHTVTSVRIAGVVWEDEHPFQLDDLDSDGRWDQLYFQVAIHGGQTLVATLSTGPEEEAPTFAKRADAMADADQSPDVTKPAWESDRMGYCAYGAAQIDALGKVIPKLSLDFFYNEPRHSQHGFTVEHGQDFLSVGNTMGAHAPFVREPDGTIARPWTTDAYTVKGPLDRNARHVSRVLARGPLRAIVETRIDQWTTDLGEYACSIRYTIAAGQRHTRVRVRYETIPDANTPPTLGAGTRAFPEDLHVQRGEGRLLVASRHVHERGLLVPWMGRAIVAADHVALKPLDIPDHATPLGITGTGPNYGVLFPEAGREVEYGFLACWSLDEGISSWPKFQSRVERLQRQISVPVTVTPNRAEAAPAAP